MELSNEQLYNKKLIEEYPWLLPRNRFTDKVPEDYDYNWTELDHMPKGWKLAFGIKLCRDLKKALGNYNNQYRISQIKEKYGTLRWYDFGITKEGNKVILKYTKKSGKTCRHCGKRAKCQWHDGWLEPICSKCKAKQNRPN